MWISAMLGAYAAVASAVPAEQDSAVPTAPRAPTAVDAYRDRHPGPYPEVAQTAKRTVTQWPSGYPNVCPFDPRKGDWKAELDWFYDRAQSGTGAVLVDALLEGKRRALYDWAWRGAAAVAEDPATLYFLGYCFADADCGLLGQQEKGPILLHAAAQGRLDDPAVIGPEIIPYFSYAWLRRTHPVCNYYLFDYSQWPRDKTLKVSIAERQQRIRDRFAQEKKRPPQTSTPAPPRREPRTVLLTGRYDGDPTRGECTSNRLAVELKAKAEAKRKCREQGGQERSTRIKDADWNRTRESRCYYVIAETECFIP